tara:strand:- start:303 stop:467 length:165 start_codon:yes stop_codon:yes gene_type:complete
MLIILEPNIDLTVINILTSNDSMFDKTNSNNNKKLYTGFININKNFTTSFEKDI